MFALPFLTTSANDTRAELVLLVLFSIVFFIVFGLAFIVFGLDSPGVPASQCFLSCSLFPTEGNHESPRNLKICGKILNPIRPRSIAASVLSGFHALLQDCHLLLSQVSCWCFERTKEVQHDLLPSVSCTAMAEAVATLQDVLDDTAFSTNERVFIAGVFGDLMMQDKVANYFSNGKARIAKPDTSSNTYHEQSLVGSFWFSCQEWSKPGFKKTESSHQVGEVPRNWRSF